MSVLELTFKKRGALYEKSDLPYQQHYFFLFLSFHLLDGICRRIVLFGGDRLGLVVACASALGNSNRDDRPHTHLLHFGNRPLCHQMAKRALRARVLLAILALCNAWNIGSAACGTHLLFESFEFIKENSE